MPGFPWNVDVVLSQRGDSEKCTFWPRFEPVFIRAAFSQFFGVHERCLNDMRHSCRRDFAPVSVMV
ncbi:MAG: hypothetical protein EBS05_05945 [Proteobacteria bacterium]|nr:hypothetical protein [Pseudomonadota bacterium]